MEHSTSEGVVDPRIDQRLAPLRFLVVDDSATMRRIVSNSMKTFGAENLVEAVDGNDACVKLMTQPFDFVITDWNMPNVSGLELTQWIRAREAFRELPVLMVTTRDNKDDVMLALKARVNNYIVKPFLPTALHDKINQVIASLSSDHPLHSRESVSTVV